MQKGHTEFDVIIVGAGLVGASMALSLARATSLRIAVVEQGQRVTENRMPGMRVSALGKLATGILKDIAVWQNIDVAARQTYQHMKVWDENSHGFLSFSAHDYGQNCLGTIVDNTDCIIALHEQLIQATNIDTFFEFNCAELMPPPVNHQAERITLGDKDGQELSADLLIAADGRQSWVRQQYQVETATYDYRQQGIVAVIETEQPHQNTAYQRFLQTGPLAVLPFSGNQSSIVWSADKARAQQLLALSDEEFSSTLATALQCELGSVVCVSPRLSFPLSSQRTQRYLQPGCALIGDAAHAIHPLAGQGANLGFKDIAALTEVLEQCIKSDLTLTDAAQLRRFERQRKADNEMTDFSMSMLYRAYQIDKPWFNLARGVGMNLVQETAWLKRQFALQAMGLND